MAVNNRTIKWINKTEEDSNMYVVKTIVGSMIALLVTWMLNEINVYHVDKVLMRIVTLAVVIITAFIWLFTHTYHHARYPISKYVVLGATFLVTLCEVSVLGFFAMPFCTYPMLAAAHYHSKRVNVYAIGGSLLCGIFGPVIGYAIHAWDLKFYLWIVYIIDPDLIPMEYIYKGMAGTELAGKEAIVKYISVPNAVFLTILGVLSFTVNISRRKRQEKEINTILDMQDKMLYSMADIIENRDFSTGGHVKRTSGLVKIMADYLKEHPVKNGEDYPKEDFYDAIIKGAPLHDLGKITISDTILCKPGSLTDEEFEKIKTHPEQSVKIINQVLGSIEDISLLEVAKNIALYHHEKYNGKGYPDGLAGKQIPLEARVMAIADVYDALVSERCYKKPVSHEEAFDIINQSFGSHFDPELKDCFYSSFDKFKAFYND